ncbi:lecithin retinol acyltransferase family protein [Butyrivibrio sp. INlla16]|uniref:lecithin retinol acyltransferase family protein n=1 Tax=Butyrivibrio sp. INlla16 TaxID=1520807 RepID=UPI00089080E0|nr:lecithin retinol acyltransferase family protein [Butyrivibrio sp. INlla16]SDB13767.1 Lecithin retinol acyltransferase [Butyrivibrio sp. INlla16]
MEMLANIPLKVMDKEIFWDTSRSEKGWKLQKHSITGHARILNEKGIRMAWGACDEMNDFFDKLIKPWKGCKKGDILAVQRYGGIYSHYAVYIGYGKVIHFAQEEKDGIAGACNIHKADFSEFLKTDTCYEIIHFPEDGSDPVHECVNLNDIDNRNAYETVNLIPGLKAAMRNLKGYHLYSAKETVERAKSRIGETKYNLALNNCEHFALWCKTGLKESSQVEDLWKSFWLGRNKTVSVERKGKKISYA